MYGRVGYRGGPLRAPPQGRGGTSEMVIDGPTLSRVLGTAAEGRLAALAARCSGVVVCRASPAQKAAIVRLMARHELYGEQARAPRGRGPPTRPAPEPCTRCVSGARRG